MRVIRADHVCLVRYRVGLNGAIKRVEVTKSEYEQR